MARFTNPLARVRVASPCKADWDQMIGTDRVRFCGQCNLNVYNLSAMTRDQAESVIAANEGRLCVRFYRRRDGSIITQDCPIGWRAVHARISYWMKAAAAAVLTFLTVIGIESILRNFHPFEPQATTGVVVLPHYNKRVEVEQGEFLIPQPPAPPVVGKAVLKPTPRRQGR